MNRHQALKQWQGRTLVDMLASQGILIRSPSYRGVAEEAPAAFALRLQTTCYDLTQQAEQMLDRNRRPDRK
jgi:hypothetical protein